MLCKRMTTLPFLLLELSTFIIFDSDYPLILCLLCKSKTLWNIFPDDMSHTIMTTLPFLILVLSPFVMSDSDYPLISCPLISSCHSIIRFLINMQVQGQHPHQWAPFQTAGLLHAWQISH